MKGEEVFEDEVDVKYLFFPAHRQSNILLITFSSFPELDELPQYDLVDSLEEFECNRLHLLDDFGSRGCYYLCENKDYKIERSVVKLINQLCKEQGIVRKIALGANEGGTAAIYYSIKYDFDTVIAETPHFYIGQHVKKLPDFRSILDFMVGIKDDQSAVHYLDDIVTQIINSKEYCRTKMVICTRKEDDESFQSMNIQHLVNALNEKRIPYILSDIDNSLQTTDTAGFFSSKLKKHLSAQIPFSSLIDYQIEIIGDTLTLELTTSNIADKLALRLCINGKEVSSTWDSLKRKYYFDIIEEGIYQFTVFITNIFEHRRALKLTPIEVSNADDNNTYKWIESSKKKVKTRYEARLEKLEQEVDKEFFSSIKEKIDTLPASNGSRYYDPFAVRIAIVADQSLLTAYDGIAECKYVTPDNYWEADVFLVTNTWKGLDGEWVGLAEAGNKKRKQLAYMIDAYRSSGAKIVFYSEGSAYYKTFLKIAKLCDYVFTVDEEQVASYQKDCGHDEVYVLSLGVNPVIHNPIGFRKFKKLSGAIFSGGWDKEKQSHEIQMDTRMIFNGISKKSSLKIIDENLGSEGPPEVRYWFPDEYFKYVSPAISEMELRKVYKLFNWAICLSGIKYSNTIASRNLYALQASGNIVFSNYNKGLNNQFPHVFTVFDEAEVSEIIHGFTEDELYQHQLLGIRRVMSMETNYHRMVEMMQMIGVPIAYPIRKVAVIVEVVTDKVSDMFHGQSYEYKELLLESELSEDVLEVFDFIAYFSAKADYDTYYLEDMVDAFKYVDVDFVTKIAYYLDGELQAGDHHDYVDSYEDKMRTVFSSRNYQKMSDLDDCTSYQGYAVDPFEFRVGEMPQARQVKQRDYKLAVVIPVYNNGDYLLNKAFNSLLRSEIFHFMEVIIIDDGSTDRKTPRIIGRLASKYANVKMYLYPEGGSGSASRPRNKAIEMATAEYIAFLDPDDEMINDGMNVLYQAIAGSNYDMVVGESLIVSHLGVKRINYFDLVKKVNKGSEVVDDTRDFFVKMNFKPKRLQEIIVRRELIREHELMMVIGALGQDTLFFQEAVLVSKKIKFIDEIVGLYYRAVDGSVMNSVSIALFEKYFIREKEAINRYSKHDVLSEFLELRYEKFFTNWYFPRLKKVSDNEFDAAVDVLREIIDLYKPYYTLEHGEMIKFYKLATSGEYKTLRGIY